jgi:hypothetical protein
MKRGTIYRVLFITLLIGGIVGIILFQITAYSKVMIQGKLLNYIDSVSFHEVRLFFDTGNYTVPPMNTTTLHIGNKYRVVDYYNIFNGFLREDLQEWY